MFLLAALSLGFLGSFHCIGMCGPIALSIPVNRSSAFSVVSGSLVYNSGRMITYSIMGLFFGLLGQGLVFAGWQNALSIGLGIGILIILFLPKLSGIVNRAGFMVRALEKLKTNIRKLFGIHSTSSLLIIGILNGFLPCGLVYLGIAGAIATGNAFNGALFMAVFGFGTFPTMVGITFLKNYISVRFRSSVRKLVPVFAGVMAVLLILRGMDLGIPYLSPKIEKTGESVHQACCKKMH
jgi:sulfite exporter TauE/SafE